MTLYKIRDWEKHFENNRSRKVEKLRWVAIPNSHDGQYFSEIMVHPDGAMIFAAWVLIVQVASKCEPRGTLIRDDKTPHTATSMAVKCRCPATWMAVALKYLSEHTDWIESVDVTTERQATATCLPPACQSGDEEGREGKERREGGKEDAPATDSVVDGTIAEWPSESEWMQACDTAGIPKWKATDEWLKQESARPKWARIGDWRVHVRRVLNWWQADGSPQDSKRNGTAPKRRVHHITGQYLD